MRSRFDEQLALLNREMIKMGALCEEAIETAKQLSNELTEKLDFEIEKSKEVMS